jgi:AhpD family alkylhydroperoxidase
MGPRLIFETLAPRGEAAMTALHDYLEGCGLPKAILELVYVRASQINACAYCLAMHAPLAREAGVDQAKLDALPAWREHPAFDARERAALAWTEAVTLASERDAGDALWAEVRRHFAEKEAVDLTLAIVGINGWNRLMTAFRVPPGT